MKKRIVLVLFTLFTLTAILAGCGGSAPKAPEKKAAAPLKELKVTYVKQPLNIPSIVDKANKTIVKGFEKDGTKVTFPEISSGAKQTEALAAGSLDIASCLGGTSAILAASNGADVKVVGGRFERKTGGRAQGYNPSSDFSRCAGERKTDLKRCGVSVHRYPCRRQRVACRGS